MAPPVGFEPTTLRLTAECSTAELWWNTSMITVTNIYSALRRTSRFRAVNSVMLLNRYAAESRRRLFERALPLSYGGILLRYVSLITVLTDCFNFNKIVRKSQVFLQQNDISS
jgi:hypothetical protein